MCTISIFPPSYMDICITLCVCLKVKTLRWCSLWYVSFQNNFVSYVHKLWYIHTKLHAPVVVINSFHLNKIQSLTWTNYMCVSISHTTWNAGAPIYDNFASQLYHETRWYYYTYNTSSQCYSISDLFYDMELLECNLYSNVISCNKKSLLLDRILLTENTNIHF